MPDLKSSYRKAADELDKEQAAEAAQAAQPRSYAGPDVTNYGTIHQDIIKAQTEAAEARMTPAEQTAYWNARHKLRTGKK